MSDKFTPTTEDVFDAYDHSYDQVEFPSDKDYQEHLAGGGARGEFYRWLAEHDRQVLNGYVKTPGLGAVAAAISTQCGHKWEDIPPMSANAYLRMAQAVLDVFEEAPHE